MSFTTQVTREVTRTPRLRRALSSASNYVGGIDLWYLVISSMVVLVFGFLALFPGVVAPYEPNEEAGPRMLPPGDVVPGYAILISAESSVHEVSDLGETFRLGVLAGEIDVTRLKALWEDQVGESSSFIAQRYITVEELLDAVGADEVDAAVVSGDEFDTAPPEVVDAYSTLIVLETEFTGRSFLFGTDQLGRDVFSRVVWGTRVAMIIGLSAPALSAIIGLMLGISSAYIGGRIDRVAAGAMDAMYALPVIVVAVALAAAIGPGLVNLIVALSVVYIPTFYRLARSRALSVKQEVYIDATEALGAGRLRTVSRHILPNSVVSVGVFASLATAQAIRVAATLSFLGLGLASSQVAEWGSDIARARQVVLEGPWLLVAPGMALSLLVFGLTLMSDVLFENLNPRLRRAT